MYIVTCRCKPPIDADDDKFIRLAAMSKFFVRIPSHSLHFPYFFLRSSFKVWPSALPTRLS